MGIERRKHSRIKLNLKVIVSNADGTYYRTDSHAKIINLSQGGICFESTVEFNEGKQCFLEFYPYTQRSPVKTVGTIVWRKKNPYLSTYGVNFANLNFLDNLVLKRFVLLYQGKRSSLDKSLIFWEIIFLALLMYVLSRFCVLLPLGFVIAIIVFFMLSFYLWLLIGSKRK